MSRPTRGRATLTASAGAVSGNSMQALAASAAVFAQSRPTNTKTDRNSIAKAWQVEAYRHVNICGEARYGVTLFAAVAGRAEIGVTDPQTLGRTTTWTKTGPEVDQFAAVAPTVRERKKLIRDFMTHWVIAGECYMIARKRVDTDPGYKAPPTGFEGTWEQYLTQQNRALDLFAQPNRKPLTDPNEDNPLWEIVAVTELQKEGTTWKVRHDNGEYITLAPENPIIRLWNPDPENRREAWSPFRSMLTTLREIEWLTMHIFTQVRSRMMSAGVWFLPDNITFAPPPVDQVEGGAEAIARMNEAEKFAVSLAASSMQMLDGDEVSFPSIVMADADALAAVDQSKLITFWSKIDDNAMVLRDGAIRRFANGMDMPADKVVNTTALAAGKSGSSGSGQMNHWGEWALDEQTITEHIEPALDSFVGTLTSAVLRVLVEGTKKIIGYNTADLRLRPDRSAEAMELNSRGLLKNATTLRETGFDAENDMMDDEELKRWALVKMLNGSPSPEMMVEALRLLGQVFNLPAGGAGEPADGQPGTAQPPSQDDLPVPQGPPEGDHDHKPAPFGVIEAAAEGLVLRALEKAGNRLLNNGKRGREKDKTTPPHFAHVVASAEERGSTPEFDFTMLPTVLASLAPVDQAQIGVALHRFCTRLYENGEAYTREALVACLKAA